MMSFKDHVRNVASNRIIFTAHALEEMNNEDEIITIEEIKYVILKGEIIEDYPEDKRGHSCLMLGFPEKKRAVHIVCAPKSNYLVIITSYIPDLKEWENDFKTRKK